MDADCDGWSDYDADLDDNDADTHGGDDCDDTAPRRPLLTGFPKDSDRLPSLRPARRPSPLPQRAPPHAAPSPTPCRRSADLADPNVTLGS